MGEVFEQLDAALIDWIGEQHVYFVASAPESGGHVNLSPKGDDTFRVFDESTVAYLDLTGSGAETIAHVRQNERLTIMFCAFAGPPRILRLFGRATVHLRDDDQSDYESLAADFPDIPGARSVIELAVERVQTSCGYAVPKLNFADDRPTLRQWAARRSAEELVDYRREKNATSIDGLPAITTAPSGA